MDLPIQGWSIEDVEFIANLFQEDHAHYSASHIHTTPNAPLISPEQIRLKSTNCFFVI